MTTDKLKEAQNDLVKAIQFLLDTSDEWEHLTKYSYPGLIHPRGVELFLLDTGEIFMLNVDGVSGEIPHEDLVVDHSRHNLSALFSKADDKKINEYRSAVKRLLDPKKPTLWESFKAKFR